MGGEVGRGGTGEMGLYVKGWLHVIRHSLSMTVHKHLSLHPPLHPSLHPSLHPYLSLCRVERIRAFSSASRDSPTVFLVSLKAGGTGLNLTAGTRVHMMDPWWNPTVEDQAVDRVYRLGQTSPVVVHR